MILWVLSQCTVWSVCWDCFWCRSPTTARVSRAQVIGALTIFGWVFVASMITFFVIKMVMGLRVSEEEEYEGADLSECGMEAYPEFASAK